MKKVVFTFGRFQPPTIGHAKLINKVISEASRLGAEGRVYTSQSEGDSKNPLPWAFKNDLLQKLFPKAKVMHDRNAKTAFNVCRILSDDGYEDVTMVVGSDRVEEFKTTIGKYIKLSSDPHFDPSKHYSFKRFNVVSAGQRTIGSGVSGASGTKMRDFVRQDDFNGFLENFPSKNVSLARSAFKAIQRNLKEETFETVDESIPLLEGINDPGIFKAIFMAGGPGSGKDFIMKKIVGGMPLTELNSDTAFKHLMVKSGFPLIMDKNSAERDVIRGRAKTTTKEKQRLIFANRLGVIINGTGDDVYEVSQMKAELERIGYETAMIFVSSSDEVSRQRNIDRGKAGDRQVPEAIRSSKWEASQRNIDAYREIFNKHFFLVDNSDNINTVTPNRKREIENNLLGIYRFFRKFLSSIPTKASAVQWIKDQMAKRHLTQFRQQHGQSTYDPRQQYEELIVSPEDQKRGLEEIANLFGIEKELFIEEISSETKYVPFSVDNYDGVKPGSDKYIELKEEMDNLTLEELEDLVNSSNPYISKLAKNRIIFKKG